MTKEDVQKLQAELDEISTMYSNGLISAAERLESQISLVDIAHNNYLIDAVERLNTEIWTLNHTNLTHMDVHQQMVIHMNKEFIEALDLVLTLALKQNSNFDNLDVEAMRNKDAIVLVSQFLVAGKRTLEDEEINFRNG